MNRDCLDVFEADGHGYRPLIDFGSWRVAVLRFDEALRSDRIRRIERHTESDEVFVLLAGGAVLIVGGTGRQPESLEVHAMQAGRIYNLRRNAWHTSLLGADATVLHVENRDTGPANTQFADLDPDRRLVIQEAARRHLAG